MRKIYAILLLLLKFHGISAQDLKVFEISGTSGVFAAHANPDMLADSRFRWNFNLGTVISRYSSEGIQDEFMPLSNLKLKLHEQQYTMQQNTYLGPSFMYQLPAGNSFAVSTAYRYGQRIDPNLNRLFNGGFSDFDTFQGQIRTAGIRELIFSYAHPYTYREHMIKGGISLKLLSMYQSLDFAGALSKSNGMLTGTFDGGGLRKLYYEEIHALTNPEVRNKVIMVTFDNLKTLA